MLAYNEEIRNSQKQLTSLRFCTKNIQDDLNGNTFGDGAAMLLVILVNQLIGCREFGSSISTETASLLANLDKTKCKRVRVVLHE